MTMSDDSCLFKWSQFQDNAMRTFNEQRTEDLYTDVTLVADDNSMMKAHKLILTASSDYFSNLFKTMPSGYPILCLDGASHSELNYLLDFIYKGELQIPKENVYSFLQLSEKYLIKGLKDISLQSKNIQEYIPKECHDLMPKDSANDFVRNTVVDDEIEMNFQEISDADEILNLEEGDVSSNPPSKENKVESKTDQTQKESNEGQVNPWFHNQNLMVNINGGQSLPYKEFEKCLWQLYRKNKFGFLECNKCSKTDSLSHMKEHVERHLVGLSFECKLCGKIMRYSRQNRYKEHKYICQMKQKSIILSNSKIADDSTKSKKYPVPKDPKNVQTESYDQFSTLDENIPLKNDDVNVDFLGQKSKIESNSASPFRDNSAAKQNLSYYLGDETFSHDEFEKYTARLYVRKELGSSKCNICGKRSSFKAHMKEHVEIHLNNFFVVCNLCGRKMPNSQYNRQFQHKITCVRQ